jgi:hypothetical protein
MKCINCNHNILPEDINTRKDTVFCRNCETVFKLSTDYPAGIESRFSISDPPAGAWFEQNLYEIKVGVSTRSYKGLLVVPFLIGIIMFFTIKDDSGLSSIFEGAPLIFKIFFAVSWLFSFFQILFFAAGKIELTLSGEGGKIFTGIWKFGRTRKFLWKDIGAVREIPYESRWSKGNAVAVAVEGKTRIAFGTILSDSRKYYLYRSLKYIHYCIRTKSKLPVFAGK